MTGDLHLITQELIAPLREALAAATGVFVVVAFAMTSGVEMLIPLIEASLDRGADVKILVGDYLYVTEPKALDHLLALASSGAEVRLWQSGGRSFHPKAYIVEGPEGGLTFVGSSNLSRSALTTGEEWNVAIGDPDFRHDALEAFLARFYHEQTRPLNRATVHAYREACQDFRTRHPNLVDAWSRQESLALTLPVSAPDPGAGPDGGGGPVEPHPIQTEALRELQTTLDEGYRRALVVMATGLGKTYLAALFAKQFRRVLFVAHREEILRQARAAFFRIMPDRSTALYFAKEQDDADLIFCSIFTMGARRHRERFPREHFDLIIIDEFHHAAAPSYQGLLEYFKPRFLLGLTATPDRADQRDIYGLCDGNVAYQIDFLEGIRRGLLAPFRYFGIHDPADYSGLRWRGGRYDEEDLLQLQLQDSQATAIMEAWSKYRQTRTLAFCSSVLQADYLAGYFQDRGIRAAAVHSRGSISRSAALMALAQGSLDILFTVDLFNEGVDVPVVDTLLFVRPTESAALYVQQLGRGLRLAPGKQHCHIIDLIGNYRNVEDKLKILVSGSAQTEASVTIETLIDQLPPDCTVDLDVGVIDLVTRLLNRTVPRRELVRQAYQRLAEERGHPPGYLEFHLFGGVDTRIVRQEFRSFVGFLSWAGLLTPDQEGVFAQYKGFLEEVEATSMTKSYKMVLLHVMLSRGPSRWHHPISAEEAAGPFFDYLMATTFRRQTEVEGSRSLKSGRGPAVAALIAQMPMTHWSNSSQGWATREGRRFRLNIEATDEATLEVLHDWTRDICAYRLHQYFSRRARE